VASRPWSPAEMALLERHAETNDWATVSHKIRDRTVNAVKVKMSKLRRELGFDDGRFVDGGERAADAMDHYNENAVVASRALLAAIEQAGVRP
jgi:hypothetical protein